MTLKKTLGIIGAGNVGLTLAILAQRSGHYEVRLGARNAVKAGGMLDKLGEVLAIVNPADAAKSDVVLLTVPDGDIQPLCESIAGDFQSDAVVAHCSGALSSDVLSSADCAVASVHPLQTFPGVAESLGRVAGTFCYYEGDAAAQPIIAELAKHLMMKSVLIEKKAKTLYHASAVMACNYFTALMDASLALAETAGIDRLTMWRSLGPLVSTTLDNIGAVGAESALTGPVVRGDAETVRQHLGEIDKHFPTQKLQALYKVLGLHTVDLAQRSERVSAEKLELVRALLMAETN